MAIPVTVYDVFDAVINKRTPFHEYEPYVEYWHTHETGNTLQEFLCMTDSQYEAFLQKTARESPLRQWWDERAG